jgi:hypothetical protein
VQRLIAECCTSGTMKDALYWFPAAAAALFTCCYNPDVKRLRGRVPACSGVKVQVRLGHKTQNGPATFNIDIARCTQLSWKAINPIS